MKAFNDLNFDLSVICSAYQHLNSNVEQEILEILKPMSTKNYVSGWNQCLHHVALWIKPYSEITTFP